MYAIKLYIYLYPSALEDQRVWLGYNYLAGSYTPVVTFDLAVIPQRLAVIPQWLNFKASQSINSDY